MRLIDADTLKERIASIKNPDMLTIGKVGGTIDTQPTAYDIDKVVEELENYRSQYEKISLSINDEVERRIYVAKEVTMYNSIEIVKEQLQEQIEEQSDGAAVLNTIDDHIAFPIGIDGKFLYTFKEEEVAYINRALQKYDLIKEIKQLLQESK